MAPDLSNASGKCSSTPLTALNCSFTAILASVSDGDVVHLYPSGMNFSFTDEGGKGGWGGVEGRWWRNSAQENTGVPDRPRVHIQPNYKFIAFELCASMSMALVI